jgi:LysM repeat protein
MGYVSAQNAAYSVQPGDTLWIIGQKYGVSTENLMKTNNITGNTVLYPGQSLMIPLGSQSVHIVQSGETYWTISKKYGIEFEKLLTANGASEQSRLDIGDRVIIPSLSQTAQSTPYTVQSGDTFWTVSRKFNVDYQKLLDLNGANDWTYLQIGQIIKIPGNVAVPTPPPGPATGSKPYVTYISYTSQRNDTIWGIAEKFGIPAYELLKANNMTDSTPLYAGRTLKIPVHHIPVKATPGEKYGELLDWWSEAQYVIPRGTDFVVVDFYTGKSFSARRTAGANHADCETLTVTDTNKMKAVWGGSFSWTRRPVIIIYQGRKIAASMTAMPHAGNDSAPGGVWTSWRSGGYASGTNHDYIKGNGADGHFDIHFLNSTRHKDGALDSRHQANVKIAGGTN